MAIIQSYFLQNIKFLTFNPARFRTEKSCRISQTEIIALTLANIWYVKNALSLIHSFRCKNSDGGLTSHSDANGFKLDSEEHGVVRKAFLLRLTQNASRTLAFTRAQKTKRFTKQIFH